MIVSRGRAWLQEGEFVAGVDCEKNSAWRDRDDSIRMRRREDRVGTVYLTISWDGWSCELREEALPFQVSISSLLMHVRSYIYKRGWAPHSLLFWSSRRILKLKIYDCFHRAPALGLNFFITTQFVAIFSTDIHLRVFFQVKVHPLPPKAAQRATWTTDLLRRQGAISINVLSVGYFFSLSFFFYRSYWTLEFWWSLPTWYRKSAHHLDLFWKSEYLVEVSWFLYDKLFTLCEERSVLLCNRNLVLSLILSDA